MKLYIFDADDTLRRSTMPERPCPHGPDEWDLRPNVREILAGIEWGEHGARLGVASNQDHIGYGLLAEGMARRLLEDMVREAIGEIPPRTCIRLCPHTPEEGCDCRKPAPGMLLDILRHFGVAGDEALFVGDTENDREAARRAGIRFA